jgi:2-polyprenyl-3-methyl-5-hydroxy-6-metoxy-1,4-benzoquinol methylase
METRIFNHLKEKTIERLKSLYNVSSKGKYDEQALPSYINSNPLMQYLFWERIRLVLNHLNQKEKYNVILDFGSGLGILQPILSKNSNSVISVDLDTSNAEKYAKEEKLENIFFFKDINSFINKYENKIELIIAMDVLEHIENVGEVLSDFHKLLKPEGKLIITGPTENIFYKVGRYLARYSGDYHKRNIYSILDSLENNFHVCKVTKLFPFPVFFLCILADKKMADQAN